MTVCKIHKNDAENRLKEMYKNDWKRSSKSSSLSLIDEDEISEQTAVDISDFIFDRISERIIQRFKGHAMEYLIEEILKAKGFQTFRSPEGADHGVDYNRSFNSYLLGCSSTGRNQQQLFFGSRMDQDTVI